VAITAPARALAKNAANNPRLTVPIPADSFVVNEKANLAMPPTPTTKSMVPKPIRSFADIFILLLD
jgi:hypothetical protein